MNKLLIIIMISFASQTVHAEYSCSTDRERYDAAQMACNVASYMSMMCTSVSAVAAAFTYSIPCAAPIALAESLCSMALSQRESFQSCRYMATDREPKGQAHAMVRYINRHEHTMNSLENYPDLILSTAIQNLIKKGIDPRSETGQTFLAHVYQKAKEITDSLLIEESEEFEFLNTTSVKQSLNQEVAKEKLEL
jgi:hypothetical protein